MDETAVAKVVKGLPWIPVLAIVCACIVSTAWIFRYHLSTNLGYLMGEFIVYTLIIWAIFLIILRKEDRATRGGIAFGFIYGTMLISGWTIANYEKRQAIIAMKEINEIMHEFRNGSPPPTNLGSIRASGDFGEIEYIIKEAAFESLRVRAEYDNELKGIQFITILDPDFLKRDSYFILTKSTLKAAQTIVDKYQDIDLFSLYTLQSKIQHLNVPKSLKNQLFKGYNEGFSKKRENLLKQWKIERNILQEYWKIVELLERCDHWEPRNGKFAFLRNSDLAAFNSMLSQINDLTQKEQAIQKTSLDELNADVQRILSSAQ